MNIKTLSTDLAQMMSSIAKGEEKKEDSGELFALLMAALSAAQVSAVNQAVPSKEQQENIEAVSPTATNSVQSLLGSLPEGITIDQLLLQLPKNVIEGVSVSENLAVVPGPVDAALEPADELQKETSNSTSTEQQVVSLEPLELKEVNEGDMPTPVIKKNETKAIQQTGTGNELELNSTAPPTAAPTQPSSENAQPAQYGDTMSTQQSAHKQDITVTSSPQRSNDASPAPSVTSSPASEAPSTPIVSNIPTEITPESLQQLRTEIIAYSSNPARPSVTLEITPPEYGRVVVRAESTPQGQVTIRLIVDTPIAKEAVMQQLPQMFTNTTTSPATVAVYTAEEYQEFTEDRQNSQHDRERRQKQRRETKEPRQVEFVI